MENQSSGLNLSQISALTDAYQLLEQIKNKMVIGRDGKAIIDDVSIVEQVQTYFGGQGGENRIFPIVIHLNFAKGCGVSEKGQN